MPGLDGTGPFGEPNWPCRRMYGRGAAFRSGFGRSFDRGFGYAQRARFTEPVTLTKDDQKKILEAELKEIELEKQEIENKLKELERSK